jgi:hypothetical protein
MKNKLSLWQWNRRNARLTWGRLDRPMMDQLKFLTMKYWVSVAAGDVQLLNGNWYVTHSGLVGIAHRKRCSGIRTTVEKSFSDPTVHRWVCKATVYRSAGSRSFVGHGDADPSNVSPLVRGAELRIAETRAINRALRKAYGIGLCSVEELGYLPSQANHPRKNVDASLPPDVNGSINGQPRLRDRLCLLIRQHQLDPTLVKRYAADFCGTQELREASRELVESFITTLAQQAVADRDGLICKLNSYGHSEAVQS